MFLRPLEFLLPSSVFHRTATECHSAVRGRGGSLGLHTGNQWHRRIDSRANGWKEILTVCTAEPFPRAAAVGIFTVSDYTCFFYCYLYLSNFTAFNEEMYNKTKLIRTSYFSELQIFFRTFFVNFRFCVSYVYLFKTQMMVLINFLLTNLCFFVVTERRAKIS